MNKKRTDNIKSVPDINGLRRHAGLPIPEVSELSSGEYLANELNRIIKEFKKAYEISEVRGDRSEQLHELKNDFSLIVKIITDIYPRCSEQYRTFIHTDILASLEKVIMPIINNSEEEFEYKFNQIENEIKLWLATLGNIKPEAFGRHNKEYKKSNEPDSLE